MTGLAHEIGFTQNRAQCSWQNTTITWEEPVASFTKGKPDQQGRDEPAKGTDAVKVYPVRTELSRYLTSDADCAVVVIPTLVKEHGAIPDTIREAAAKYIAELNLPRKRKVAFFVQYVKEEDKERLLREFNEFCETLGFGSGSTTLR